MATDNICNYHPIHTLSIKAIDERFRRVHRSLCYLESITATGPVQSAVNGLSTLSGEAVLGQDVGEAGNPAALTSTREIPVSSFSINLVSEDAYTKLFAGTVVIQGAGSTLVLRDDTDSKNFTLIRETDAARIQYGTLSDKSMFFFDGGNVKLTDGSDPTDTGQMLQVIGETYSEGYTNDSIGEGAGTWKFGSVVDEFSEIDAARHVEVEINGTIVKLAVIQ